MPIMMTMYILTSLLLIAVSIPLVMRRINPNGFYGFRVKKTLQNPQIWYDVNAYFGRLLIAVGVVSLILSIGLGLIPRITVDFYAIVNATVTGLCLMFVVAMSLQYMRKL